MTLILYALPVGRSTLAIDLIKYFDLKIDIQVCQRTDNGWNNPEFEKHFPLKKFPALLETNENYDNKIVFSLHEVTAILLYLLQLIIKEKKHNIEQKRIATKLLGGNSNNETKTTCDIIKWLSFVSSELIPAVVVPLRITLGLDPYDKAKVDLGLETANALLVKAVEPVLKKQKFVNNQLNPCIADLFLMIPISFLASVSWNENWTTEHTEIAQWTKDVITHDIVAARYKDLVL